MERLDELVERREKLVHWITELKNIMESIQTFIPVVGHAVHNEMRREIMRIDLEVLDIHEVEGEALRGEKLRHCVSPRTSPPELDESEIPF